MSSKKVYWLSIIYMVVGFILFGLGSFEVVDEFWSGMGAALFTVGTIKLIRRYRFDKNEAFREKIEIEEHDERNHFIRNKAWAWAGYLYVMIVAVACIVLRIMGQDTLSMVASGSVCLVLVLFWVSFLILKRKY